VPTHPDLSDKQPGLLARTREIDLILAWGIALAIIAINWLYIYRHTYTYHAITGWQLYSIWAAAKLGVGHTDFLSSYRPGYMLNVPLLSLFHLGLYGLRIVTGILYLITAAVVLWGLERLDWVKPSLPLSLAIVSSCTGYFADFLMNYYNAVPVFLGLSFGFWAASQRVQFLGKSYVYAFLAAVMLAIASWSNFSVIIAGMVVSLVYTMQARSRYHGFVLVVAFYGALALLLIEYFWHYGVWAQYQYVLAHPVVHHKIALQALGNEFLVRTIFLVGYTGITLLGILLAWLVWAGVKTGQSQQKIWLLPMLLWAMPFSIVCFWALHLFNLDSLPLLYYLIMLASTYAVTLTLLWVRSVSDDAVIQRTYMLMLSLLIFYLFQRANSQSGYGHMGYLYLSVAFVAILPMLMRLVRSVTLRLATLANFLLLGAVIPMLINLFPTVEAGQAMPLWRNQVMVASLGVYVNKAQAQLWRRMMHLYVKYHCDRHYFLSFYDAPMPYFLLKREAPYGQSWLSRMDFYPTNLSIDSGVILRDLQRAGHWCVVFSPPEFDQHDEHNARWLVSAYQYIKDHSARRIKIGFEPMRQRTYWFFAN